MLDHASSRAGVAAAVAALVAACGSPPAAANDAAARADAAARPDAGVGPWTARAPLADGPRLEPGVVALDGSIYAIGGFDQRFAVISTVEVYDPAADAWHAAASLPMALHHANVAAFDGRIYVLGAIRGSDFVSTGDALVYDPAADAWAPRAPMPAGTERGASAVAVVGDRIVVAGGSRGDDAVVDAGAYDPAADAWEPLPDLPAGRYHAVGAAVDGVFYALGGLTTNVEPLDDVLALAPGAVAWEARRAMPTARGGCSAGVVGGAVVCAGGEGIGLTAVTEAYDPAADQWRTLPQMPQPTLYTGGAIVDDVLYVPAGAHDLGPQPSDTLWALAAGPLLVGGAPL